jgi:hypothetical protein
MKLPLLPCTTGLSSPPVHGPTAFTRAALYSWCRPPTQPNSRKCLLLLLKKIKTSPHCSTPVQRKEPRKTPEKPARTARSPVARAEVLQTRQIGGPPCAVGDYERPVGWRCVVSRASVGGSTDGDSGGWVRRKKRLKIVALWIVRLAACVVIPAREMATMRSPTIVLTSVTELRGRVLGRHQKEREKAHPPLPPRSRSPYPRHVSRQERVRERCPAVRACSAPCAHTISRRALRVQPKRCSSTHESKRSEGGQGAR